MSKIQLAFIPIGVLLISIFFVFGATFLLVLYAIKPEFAASAIAERNGLPSATGSWILPAIATIGLIIAYGLLSLSRWGFFLTITYLLYCGVEFLFIFTLAAGVLVLYSALAAIRDERVREAGLLRALGASRQQLSRAQLAELACIGALAGLLAAIGASAIGWALAKFAFEFEYTISPWVFAAGVGGGAFCALAGGYLGLRGVLKTPPLATLREA